MWTCPKCKSDVDDNDAVDCWNCDYSKISKEIKSEEVIRRNTPVVPKSDKEVKIDKLQKRRLGMIIALPIVMALTVIRSGNEFLSPWFGWMVVAVLPLTIYLFTIKINKLINS